MLFLLSLVTGASSKAQLLDEMCVALEESGVVFKVTDERVIVINLDLSPDLPAVVKAGYEKDEEGKKCLSTIQNQLERTVGQFRDDIDRFYVSARDLLKYKKETLRYENMRDSRSVGAAAMAAAVLGMIITGASHFYNDYRIGQIHDTIAEIEKQIEQLTDSSDIFRNNQEFLVREQKILSLKRKFVYKQFQELQVMHSCDIFHLQVKLELTKIVFDLRRLVDAITTGRLTNDIISIKEMEKITRHASLQDTIYLVHPALLYEYGKIVLRSISGNKVSLYLIFPGITRDKMKIVNVLSPDAELRFIHTVPKPNFQFLIPFTLSLSQVNVSLNLVANADTCLVTGNFKACYANSALLASNLYCLKSIFSQGLISSCYGKSDRKDIKSVLGTHGALMMTRGKGEIFDGSNGETVQYLRGDMCTYVPKRRKLGVVVNGNIRKIYSERLVYNRRGGIEVPLGGMLSNMFATLSPMPNVTNPMEYNDNVVIPGSTYQIFRFLKDPFVLITIIVVVICLAIISVAICQCIAKSRSSEGNIFNVGNTRATDGGVFR